MFMNVLEPVTLPIRIYSTIDGGRSIA